MCASCRALLLSFLSFFFLHIKCPAWQYKNKKKKNYQFMIIATLNILQLLYDSNWDAETTNKQQQQQQLAVRAIKDYSINRIFFYALYSIYYQRRPLQANYDPLILRSSMSSQIISATGWNCRFIGAWHKPNKFKVYNIHRRRRRRRVC